MCPVLPANPGKLLGIGRFRAAMRTSQRHINFQSHQRPLDDLTNGRSASKRKLGRELARAARCSLRAPSVSKSEAMFAKCLQRSFHRNGKGPTEGPFVFRVLV